MFRDVGPTFGELKQTQVLSIPIEEASAKIRTGPPLEDEADYEISVWAGVVPLCLAIGSPIGDPRLKSGVQPPGYAVHYQGPQCVSPPKGS